MVPEGRYRSKNQEILRREWGRRCLEEEVEAWVEAALGTEQGELRLQR